MGKLKGMQPLPKLRVPGPGGDGSAAAGASQGAWGGMPSTDRSLPGSPSTIPTPSARGGLRWRMVSWRARAREAVEIGSALRVGPRQNYQQDDE
jgi:hypothetical protein